MADDLVYLIDTTTIKTRMSIDPNIVGVDDVIQSAIAGAQMKIATSLESSLVVANFVDTFYLDETIHNGIQPNGVFKLKLRSGLVRSDMQVTVSTALSWNGFDQGVEIPITDYQLDRLRGMVYVSANQGGSTSNARELGLSYSQSNGYNGQYVQVTYQAGFGDIDEVPSWIQESIMSYVPVIMYFSQTTNRSAEAVQTAQVSEAHALAVIAPYLRPKGFCLNPMF